MSQLELNHVIHESTANNWYRCRAPLQRMCSYHFTVSVCIDRVFLLYTDGVYSAAFALNCPYSSFLLDPCILEMFSDTKTIFWSDLTSWIQSKAAIKMSDISRLLFFAKDKIATDNLTKKDSALFLHLIRIVISFVQFEFLTNHTPSWFNNFYYLDSKDKCFWKIWKFKSCEGFFFPKFFDWTYNLEIWKYKDNFLFQLLFMNTK